MLAVHRLSLLTSKGIKIDITIVSQVTSCFPRQEGKGAAVRKIKEYKAIGSVDTCRAAVAKTKGKNVIVRSGEYGICPACSSGVHTFNRYCGRCGQRLDWSNDKTVKLEIKVKVQKLEEVTISLDGMSRREKWMLMKQVINQPSDTHMWIARIRKEK